MKVLRYINALFAESTFHASNALKNYYSSVKNSCCHLRQNYCMISLLPSHRNGVLSNKTKNEKEEGRICTPAINSISFTYNKTPPYYVHNMYQFPS